MWEGPWRPDGRRTETAPTLIDLENFSGIENVFRVEGSFDLAQYVEQLVAELIAHVFGARDADAVLGRERTFELPHKRGGLIGDLPEFFQISCGYADRALDEHGAIRWRHARSSWPPVRAVS